MSDKILAYVEGVLTEAEVDYADNADLADHEAATTDVHGISDTSALATGDDVATAVDEHTNAVDPHGDRAYADGAVATRQALSEKGSPDGYAELDGTGKVPSAQLPSFVDDVVEAVNFAALPGTGETGKIYVTLDDNLTFRWSGSVYVEISASLALGETSSTAYRGDRGKTAYDHSQTTGNPHGVTKGDVGLGNVDNTSDVNKPVSTAQQTALDAKVAKSLFDANTILTADTDDTPAPLTVAASRIVGRKASGGIAALTGAEAITVLDLSSLAAGVRSSLNTGTPGQVGIDVSLSVGVSGGDTLNGGLAASENLTLGSTSHATRGTINLRDRTLLISEDKTYTDTTARVMIDTPSTRTITLSSGTAAGNQLQALRFSPLVVFGANSNATNSILGIQCSPVIKNDTSVRTITSAAMFNAAPTLRADTATLTPGGMVGFSFSGSLDVVNGGALTAAQVDGFFSTLTVGAGTTVTSMSHFRITDAAASGTLTTQIGVNIPVLSAGGTNIGLFNASTTVIPHTLKTITATTDTIPATATTIRLNNTSGSSKTLASAPTIADGQSGQVLVIVNTSANDVVLQDQGTLASSNLRLGAATRTLSQRDSIILMYQPTIADWIELAFSNVV